VRCPIRPNYRFSDQPNCIGATTGTTGSITTFPGSLSTITHPGDAESVEITILLTEFFSGAATACIDDVSFTDSGGTATAVDLAHFGADSARRLPVGALIVAVGLIALAGLARDRRTP
jgi:hypothetical protein